MVMELHEFDPSVREAPRVLELLTRAGFSYAIDEFVPLHLARAAAGADTPFPGERCSGR
jgi:hypothetical protein